MLGSTPQSQDRRQETTTNSKRQTGESRRTKGTLDSELNQSHIKTHNT